MSLADQAAVELMEGFLRAFGPPGRPADAAEAASRQNWIDADPECRLQWLGLTPERARGLGYQTRENDHAS